MKNVLQKKLIEESNQPNHKSFSMNQGESDHVSNEQDNNIKKSKKTTHGKLKMRRGSINSNLSIQIRYPNIAHLLDNNKVYQSFFMKMCEDNSGIRWSKLNK